MSRLNRSTRRRAIAGLLVVVGTTVVASTARAAAAAVMPVSPPAAAPHPGTPGSTPHDGLVESLTCVLFAYNLGPLGPLGPWGPLGPLHDKPHPACVGGGPAYK